MGVLVGRAQPHLERGGPLYMRFSDIPADYLLGSVPLPPPSSKHGAVQAAPLKSVTRRLVQQPASKAARVRSTNYNRIIIIIVLTQVRSDVMIPVALYSGVPSPFIYRQNNGARASQFGMLICAPAAEALPRVATCLVARRLCGCARERGLHKGKKEHARDSHYKNSC